MSNYRRLLVALCLLLVCARAEAQNATPVTLTEDETHYTIANGIVTAKVLKRNGDLSSLVYKGIETLTDKSGHAGAYWSHDASSPNQVKKVTIDPSTNGGERAEVSIKGISGGQAMGSGPGGAFPADIEIRWSMGRGESGVYTYCVFDHKPEYPAGSLGEARFCAKLAATFDWMSIDDRHNKHYPREIEGEDKYVYTANQYRNRAYGFSSTADKIGFFLVNPTIEYLSGGPTKVEFLCHRDTTAVQAGCVHNYWRSSHYGGAVVDVAAGEQWTKVVGPFFLYVNSGEEPLGLWKDALAMADKEAAKWPYGWVDGVDYPRSNERSTVTGQLVLKDPLMPSAKLDGKVMVGLAHPAYMNTPAPGRGGQVPPAREIGWQMDAKHYQFWIPAEGGKFAIPKVRPGTYSLYAFAEGVMGEYMKANITIPPGGKPVDLGTLEWQPVRRGRQLWQIGTPNRTATEFAGGDKYWDPESKINYAKRFPNDVNFIVGKSDPSKDWFYEHIPHNIDPNARVAPFRGVVAEPGKPTPYKITFDLPQTPKGKATLRFAFCTTSTRSIEVTVNDQPAGTLDRLGNDSTITRHGMEGIQYERELSFDASLMKQGTNTLTLTVPGGSLNNGVIYDCVRLELDESAQPTAAAQ